MQQMLLQPSNNYNILISGSDIFSFAFVIGTLILVFIQAVVHTLFIWLSKQHLAMSRASSISVKQLRHTFHESPSLHSSWKKNNDYIMLNRN
jgi:hypothetical protein